MTIGPEDDEESDGKCLTLKDGLKQSAPGPQILTLDCIVREK